MGLTVRVLPPVRRDALPQWEVVDDDGVVVGFISEERIGRHGRQVFYKATGINPETGEHINLELSGDFDERLQAIAEFRTNPAASVHTRRWTR